MRTFVRTPTKAIFDKVMSLVEFEWAGNAPEWQPDMSIELKEGMQYTIGMEQYGEYISFEEFLTHPKAFAPGEVIEASMNKESWLRVPYVGYHEGYVVAVDGEVTTYNYGRKLIPDRAKEALRRINIVNNSDGLWLHVGDCCLNITDHIGIGKTHIQEWLAQREEALK